MSGKRVVGYRVRLKDAEYAKGPPDDWEWTPFKPEPMPREEAVTLFRAIRRFAKLREPTLSWFAVSLRLVRVVKGGAR